MLALDDITLTYPDGAGRLTALDRVSLTVPDGTFAAVTGPSGSGKSSLLSVAAGLVTPDAGTVRVGDRELTGLSRKESARLRRSRLGIVFQTPNLIPSLTVREQLEILGHMGGGALHRLGRAERRARIDEVLGDVGVLDLADRRPGQLSGGQRQRVNIARALVDRPEVLLVDEPTSALDRERGDAVIELLGRLARADGLATVLVTHEPDHLRHVDAAYRMVDGRLSEIPGRERAAA